MPGVLIAVAGGALRLTAKYVVVPVLVSVATALVADEVAKRMRARTATLRGPTAPSLEGIDRIA